MYFLWFVRISNTLKIFMDSNFRRDHDERKLLANYIFSANDCAIKRRSL